MVAALSSLQLINPYGGVPPLTVGTQLTLFPLIEQPGLIVSGVPETVNVVDALPVLPA